MNRFRWMRLLALVCAFGLVAAACGDDDDDDGADTESTTTVAGEESGDEDGGDEDGGEAAGGIADLEAQWAEDRAAVVAAIQDGGYGVDGDVLTGPGGFEVDLSECPSDWDPTQGVTESSVLYGKSIAQSGNLAAFGDIAVGMGVYFDYVNANGGVDGREIELIVKDDAYDATRTIEAVDELITSDEPFSVTTLGSPNTFAVRGELNERCIPQPFVETGHQAWGDPVNFPWTTGQQLSYASEAQLWGSWIEENTEPGVTVAGLVMNNDFGASYVTAFEEFVAQSDHDINFVSQTHDPAAPAVTAEITTLASEEPDVFLGMTTGATCPRMMGDVARSGLNESLQGAFLSSTCKGVQSFMAPAEGAADGWLIVGGGNKDLTDPGTADDPFVQFVKEQVEAADLDPNISQYGNGFAFGWPYVEALRIAAELEGGITRPNFILAVRSLDTHNPMALEGIRFHMNGAEDAYLTEGSEIARFDAENQAWVIEGDVIDLDGEAGTCAWDTDVQDCVG